MAIKLKSPSEIRRMRAAGRIVAELFALVREQVRPGVSTADLDTFVEREIRKRDATPSFKGYGGPPPFPASICVAVNEQVVHGIPSPRQILREGDIIGVDIGVYHGGFHGDACVTYPVGRVSPEAERLLSVTEECLWLGIEQARAGHRVGDIGHAIQTHAEAHGYGVVRGLGGHGIGRRLHENEPSVQHAAEPGTGPILRPGMTFTIEPMINAGGADWRELADGWTVVTTDGALSAQFEHTVAITQNGPDILTKP
ncbi:MAG: Methionine aminopeptidase [uncultured Thermomicrobiales bacterium]|uniref:Methionine aminopeptidase n=1 Tax=uncultured Thermomicrobiales bacterium TaxID=1645740 RepID=A0A6J4VIP7_9BACT|nr:MAG: Methionine aminopeptidase [uncultured Thermomicrobiales bacterium]